MIRRREFLSTALAPLLRPERRSRECILLRLRGGPSQLDTWDMKPDAPREIRGPFRPIQTNVPAIEISEIFPRMARHADRFAIIRSVYHDANTHGEAEERTALPGVRNVDLFADLDWDMHGWGPYGGMRSYAGVAGPRFDAAFSSLLENLDRRGLFDSTLVVAMGEFGRTPKINPDGGRDHWPHCFSIVMAGGGIRGGQVYGSSDRIGAEPRNNPVTPAMIAATIRKSLGTELPGDQALIELF